MTSEIHRTTFVATLDRSDAAQRARRVGAVRWIKLRIIVATFCRVALFFLAGLVLWAVGPLAVGFHSTAVVTGSMEPAIPVGSMVVIRPVASSEVQPGQIVQFADPDHPGRNMLHRVADIAPDGDLTTRGDANPQDDPQPVPATSVRGVAVLVIPFVGLPSASFVSGRAVVGVLLLLLIPTFLLGAMLDRPVRAAVRATQGA